MSEFIDPALVPKFTLSNGETLPCIGLGTFGSDHADAAAVSAAVEGALRVGYRLFDCASVYQNEAEIGKIFAAAFAEGLVKREELFITSKLWNDMHGKGDVLLSLAKTLKDLQLDYVDAYFVHWPFPNYHAPHCDGDSRNPDSKPFSVEEFMRVWHQMERVHDMGLVRNLGMSNMTLAKLKAVLPLCRVKPTLIEQELHPTFQQQDIFDYCNKQGIQLIGYCPVGSPNRPARDTTPDDLVDTDLPQVKQIAKAHGIHPIAVCLKWAVQRGQIPIPFSVNPAHYLANLACVTSDPLTEMEMALMTQAEANCRLIKGQVFLWPGAADWHVLWDEHGVLNQR